MELPDDRPVTADDVRALRISVAFRGYRMTEVDWLLDQFALVLDERDAEIAGCVTAPPHPRRRRAPNGRRGRRGRGPTRPTPRPTRRSSPVPELVERIDVDAPPERVWAVLTDWEAPGRVDARHRRPDGGRAGAAAARPARRPHRAAAARRPPRRRPRHDDHHEVGAAAAGRGAAHRPADPRARASSRSSRAASTRPSSGPSGSTCPTATWASSAGAWSGRSRCSASAAR